MIINFDGFFTLLTKANFDLNRVKMERPVFYVIRITLNASGFRYEKIYEGTKLIQNWTAS